MNKQDRFYFENMIAAADCACNAAKYLISCMEDYHPDRLKDMLEEMHEYEHAGDTKKHEMSAALARAFVTPVDREDLEMVSSNIDEVNDTIEEVMQLCYMYRIQTIRPDAVAFAKKILESCELMKEMLGEFVNFKHPDKLHQMIIDVNHKEEECDVLFIESNVRLTEECTDPLEVISWRDIYSRMEYCVDACEHVSDSVDTVVMKNS